MTNIQLNLVEINKLIDSSQLSENEKNDLILLFSRVGDASLEAILRLCQSDPAWLTSFNWNFQAKKAAVNGAGSSTWEEIIEQEKKLIESAGQV